MTMRDHVDRYVALKRHLGWKFVVQGRMLRSYADYAMARGEQFTEIDGMLAWASVPGGYMHLRFFHPAIVLCAGLFLSTLGPSPAAALDRGYVVGGIGLHKPRTNDVTIGPAPAETKFKTGFVGLGALGWVWEQGFRTELELGYRDSNASTIAAADAAGSQDVFSTMGNILFDIDTGGDLAVHVGAGIGIAWTGWNSVSTAATPVFDGTESGFAYQGILGASYPISEGLDLTLDYRYQNQTGLDYTSVPAGGTAMDHDNRNHNVIVGLRFALWGPDEPPPTPAPAAQPAPPRPTPAPPPVSNLPETFIVFFDWDRSNLTPEAQAIVRRAAAFAESEGAARIAATGHADRSGPASYNLGLSERRAQAVKAELIRLGIAENEIFISWKGETENLVPTEDGVREPQNRRVEIVIE